MGILECNMFVSSVCLTVCLGLVRGSIANNPLNSLVEEAKQTGIDLETPEWLQNIPQESRVSKYRKRRFIDFPTGSTISMKFTVTIPTEGFADSGSFSGINTLTFNLPTTEDVENFGIGRALNTLGHSRQDLYRSMEDFFNGMGYDGHACVLRGICELAELPFEHGILGELINIAFSVAAPSAPSTNYLTD
ncbi:unnamed protein product, partial [Meganyctiphanes norvegica]